MVTIGDCEFQTKRAAETFIRSLLSRHGHKEFLVGEDFDFARAIIRQHPHRAIVEGCGIRDIWVFWLDSEGRQRRFELIRPDGSRYDFTWRHAIRERSPTEEVRRICRQLVAPDIAKFRENWFSDPGRRTCPISGLPITAKESDIDHVKPITFLHLFEEWMAESNLDPTAIRIRRSGGYATPDRFEDEALDASWIFYHRSNCVLRAVHPTVNRGLLRRKGQ